MNFDKNFYAYGMRLRGFSIGCQPMNGFICVHDDPNRQYHSIVVYDRELTQEELRQYELDKVDAENFTKEEA